MAGEVVKCAHCGGRGFCDCLGCNKVVLDSYGRDNVWCSTCGGAGKVWIGPSNSSDYNSDDNDDENDEDQS